MKKKVLIVDKSEYHADLIAGSLHHHYYRKATSYSEAYLIIKKEGLFDFIIARFQVLNETILTFSSLLENKLSKRIAGKYILLHNDGPLKTEQIREIKLLNNGDIILFDTIDDDDFLFIIDHFF